MTDGWSLVYEGFDPENEGLRESLCTLGNGYFATRGAAPDMAAGAYHYPGCYLAGGYNRLTSDVSGREIENEDLVNLPNWLAFTYRIDDGEWFAMDKADILFYRQELDLKSGVLLRSLRTRDANGRTTRWDERRLISMAACHLAGLSVSLTAEDWSGKITVRAGLDGSVVNDGVARYRALAKRHLETLGIETLAGDTILLRSQTNQSRIEIAQAARLRIFRADRPVENGAHCESSADRIDLEQSFTVTHGETVTAEKIVALHTSRDRPACTPGVDATTTIARAGRFADIQDAHTGAWGYLWNDCNIELSGHTNAGAIVKLRVYIFHLLQTVSPHSIDLDIGVPARGWHGEAYRGHIFWDELFIFPFLNLRLPVLTRSLLLYRYRRLDEARAAARAAGYRGAMFPWQSGSSGREETQQVHLNPQSGRWLPDTSSRQRHINSAIAYNVWQYYQTTRDDEFLNYYGAEMLIEIARFWASLASHNIAIDRYEIKGVMGPDEYHTAYPGVDEQESGGIDNNAYTNIMAAWVFDRARDAIERMPKSRCEKLFALLGFDPAEIEIWEDMSRKLRVPFHDGGVISQFEGYGDLEEFDWAGYREKYGDVQRLDRILEAEGESPNRYKLSKTGRRADALLPVFGGGVGDPVRTARLPLRP